MVRELRWGVISLSRACIQLVAGGETVKLQSGRKEQRVGKVPRGAGGGEMRGGKPKRISRKEGRRI